MTFNPNSAKRAGKKSKRGPSKNKFPPLMIGWSYAAKKC